MDGAKEGGMAALAGARHAPPHVARTDQATYDAIKAQWGERLQAMLHKHYPSTVGKVAFCNVSTPLTLENYLRSGKGAAIGLDVTPQVSSFDLPRSPSRYRLSALRRRLLSRSLALPTWQRVFKEFFFQGEQEKALGLPVTPFMDRPTASIPKAQLGFLKYLCQPLFKAMAVAIPSLEVACDCMAENVLMLTALEEGKYGTEQIMSAGRLQDLLPQMAPLPKSPAAEMPANTLPAHEA